MNRAEQIQQILRLEGIATAARRLAEQHREALAEQARAELAEQGTAPTWRMPGLGVVTMPLSREAAVVADPAALLAWAAERYPTEVETIHQVRAAFQTTLLGRAVCDGDVVVDPATGEIVPGLAVRPGGQPRALTIRADKQVTTAAVQAGREWLEGMALLAGEVPGHLEPSDVPDGDRG